MDGQVLAAITGMSCSSTTSQQASGPLQYLISPFYDLGPSAVVLGNIGLGLGCFLIRLALTSLFPDTLPADLLRFPSLDLVLVTFLMQGVVRAGGQLLFTFPSAGEGILGLVAIAYCVAVYCFAVTASRRVRPLLVFTKYAHFANAEQATEPLGFMAIKDKWLLPSGYWGPKHWTLVLGSTFARTSSSDVVQFAVFPAAASSLIALLTSIQPPQSGCTALISFIALIFVAEAVVLVRWWPLRVPGAIVTSAVSYCAMALLLILFAIAVDNGSTTIEVGKVYVTLFQTLMMIVKSGLDFYAKAIEYCYLKVQQPSDEANVPRDHRRRSGGIYGVVGVVAAWLLNEDLTTTAAREKEERLLSLDDCVEMGEPRSRHGMMKETTAAPAMFSISLSDDDDDLSSIDLDSPTAAEKKHKVREAVVDIEDTEESAAHRAAEKLRRKATEQEEHANAAVMADAEGGSVLMSMSTASSSLPSSGAMTSSPGGMMMMSMTSMGSHRKIFGPQAPSTTSSFAGVPQIVLHEMQQQEPQEQQQRQGEQSLNNEGGRDGASVPLVASGGIAAATATADASQSAAKPNHEGLDADSSEEDL
ncbi:DGF-1-like protein, putative [Bodo saltans]|uniref:DGF-1-like protein, putative n=1 Tax=Bodo saltans TaxID=75058 RepID=A0A0S4JJ28_BODSA|nr:DGF-1-like protein, putative [Bodo saltans]|eukprot:CUG88421.1 DGF-1-like protein, putative [Bodo saltans]